MTTKTRLKLTVIAGLFLAAITLTATFMKMEAVATTSIAGIMTILSAYIWAQTKRPSGYEFSDKDIERQYIQEDYDNNSDPGTIIRVHKDWTKLDELNEGEESFGKNTGADGANVKTS